MKKILSCFVFLAFISCQEESEDNSLIEKNIPQDPAFQLLSSEETGIDFINTIQNKEEFNIFRYRNFYNGGGVGIGDINNDGLEDIYFTSNQGQNRLYLNKGNFQFKDITDQAKVGGTKAWSTGVTFVDINNDGFLDIYVCNAGNEKGDDQKNELFVNQGDLTFIEKAKDYGLDEDGFTTHAAFFDYDKDGDLDVYILNNSFIPVSSLSYNNKRELRAEYWNLTENVKGGGDKLLQNQNGKFIDVSEKAGIYGSLIGFGLGVTVGDVNFDGYKDLYISNDFYERDYLYINQGDGTFVEDIMNRTTRTSLSSMGADMADINNDGSYEIFSTDMLPEGDSRLKNTTNFENYDLLQLKKSRGFYNQFMQNALQINDGTGHFKEVALFSGIAKTDWSWGALLFDMTNNGFKDLYISNGIKQDLTNQDFINFFADEVYQKMAVSGKKMASDSIINIMPSHPIQNYAFINTGDLSFENKTYDFGFAIKSFSNGSAYADLNNDGKLDLVVNNIDQEAFVFKNNTPDQNYLSLKLRFQNPNIFGVGTLVRAFVKDDIISNELMPSRGFQSSVTYKLHLGLGNLKRLDSLQVIWPNDTYQTLKSVQVNQSLEISYDDSKTSIYSYPDTEPMLSNFETINKVIQPHEEDFYVDFDHEGLIFKMQSREGPCLSIADVDGNGTQEIFIGGAKDQPAQLFDLQGNFDSELSEKVFDLMSKFEDTASSFTDIDGDGDMDLIIGSGGNFKDDSKSLYKIRILKNDGRGNFEIFQVINNPYNTSTLSPHDYDQDGDMDLFVGNFSVPGLYGVDPKSKLYENDGDGNFTNVTEQNAFDFKQLGMVKDAVWYDVDSDGVLDLVVVGEWMSPIVFRNTGRRLERIDTNLNSYSGLYQSLKAVDLDQDGKKELIFGNYGSNFKLQPESNSPIKLYVNDFDDNSTIEQIITRRINNKDKPYQLKSELAKQIPSIKKDNMSFEKYAEQSIQELFGEEKVNKSITKEITELRSFVAFQESSGNFDIKYLPKEVQWSSVQAISKIEIDDKNYLVTGGNFYHFKPQFASLDASTGNIIGFKNNTFFLKKDSGLNLKGEVRAIEVIRDTAQNSFLIVGRNNKKPIILRYEP